MKKFISYIWIFYFSIGACLPHCDFSQLLKAKDLMEHYEVHKLEARNAQETITLSEFLYIHLINGDQHEGNHHDEHEDLPLQQLGAGVNSLVSTSFELPIICGDIAIEKGTINTSSQVYSSDYISSHFQPPAA